LVLFESIRLESSSNTGQTNHLKNGDTEMERRTTDGAGIAARTTRRQLNGKRQYRERAGSVLATQFESGWMDEQNTMDAGVILI
jgi:hypothetical protein